MECQSIRLPQRGVSTGLSVDSNRVAMLRVALERLYGHLGNVPVDTLQGGLAVVGQDLAELLLCLRPRILHVSALSSYGKLTLTVLVDFRDSESGNSVRFHRIRLS